MNVAILKILARPSYLLVMLGTSLLMFDLSYYLMKSLPGTDGFSCIEGANLTAGNILFSVAISLSFGMMIAGLIDLFQKRKNQFLVSGSVSSLGLIIGSMTIFCTVCTLPVISLFGLSVGISFFTTYNLLFKLMSLKFMGTALFLLNRQLKQECVICKN